MGGIAVCTTFPNQAWDSYAKQALETFALHWPRDVGLRVWLDDPTLRELVAAVLAGRPHDIHTTGSPQHRAFLKRNAGKDHPTEYRRQASRFSHKVAALVHSMDALIASPEHAEHLFWLDADVITTMPVDLSWLEQFLPRGEQQVSYLGRRDEAQSECGFMAFAIGPAADAIIKAQWSYYQTDAVFAEPQWDDSWLFDRAREQFPARWFKNLSKGAPGNHVWLQTALAERLEHWKGVAAKQFKRPTLDEDLMAARFGAPLGLSPVRLSTGRGDVGYSLPSARKAPVSES